MQTYQVPKWVVIVAIVIIGLIILANIPATSPSDNTDGSPTCYEYGC